MISAVSKEKDNFALYHDEAGQQCALVAAGTDSAADMQDNFNGLAIHTCGFKDVHAGYWGEVQDLLCNDDFQDNFLPFLRSDNCSGGIKVVGHSLGGGVGSVFAACANNP